MLRLTALQMTRQARLASVAGRRGQVNGVSGLILGAGLFRWFGGADSVGLFDSGEADGDGNVFDQAAVAAAARPLGGDQGYAAAVESRLSAAGSSVPGGMRHDCQRR